MNSTPFCRHSKQDTIKGAYQSAQGIAINADINGACKILLKSKQNINFDKLCIRLLASPNRVRVN